MRAKVPKQAVIEKVFEIMLMKGYNDTGVREVMQSMGLHKGSFYNYFDSKEDMAIKALDHYTDRMLGWTQMAMQKTDISPIARIQLYHQVLIDHFKKELQFKGGCFVGNMSTEMGDIHPIISQRLTRFFEKMHQFFTTCIQEGQKLGEIKSTLDPVETAEFITSSWQGAVLKMKNVQNATPLDNFMKMIILVLKRV